MLKHTVKENLQAVVHSTLVHHCQDETLSYDISKQCVSDEDVDKCLGAMLEHISESELKLMMDLLNSDMYQRYVKAVSESLQTIEPKIYQTLVLLRGQAGEA